MNVLLIANPVSGGGKTVHLALRLRDLLQQAGHTAGLHLTRDPGDARARVAGLDAGLDRLVVVGGDGTLNEVLNGLPDPSRLPLCQLATGTANILAHELKLPFEPDGVARMIQYGPVRKLDMGLLGDRRFLMVVSAGFDAMVTREIAGRRSGTLGYRGYVMPILRTVTRYRVPRIDVHVDDGPAIEGGLAVVSNTRNYGGLFVLADRARTDSGHLDVCILRRASLPNLLGTALRGLTGGGLSRRRGVVYRTGRRIRLDSAEPVPVQVDGDHFGDTPVEIRIVPACVPFVVPQPDPR